MVSSKTLEYLKCFSPAVIWIFALTSPSLSQEISDSDWIDLVVPNGSVTGYSHGQFPTEGRFTHPGIDIGGECGLPILAPKSGTIERVVAANVPTTEINQLKLTSDLNHRDFQTSLGNALVLRHEDFENKPTFTLYLHMEDEPKNSEGRSWRIGDEVEAGDQLGLVGETGFAKGCHLHFEVRHFEGIRKVFHPSLTQIYGSGNISNSAIFRSDWSDPQKWLLEINGHATEPSEETSICDTLASNSNDPGNPSTIEPTPFNQIDSNDANLLICLSELANASLDQKGRATYLVARIYAKREDGGNVPPESSEYLRYLRRSADLGYPYAQYLLGAFFHDGSNGFEQDLAKASALYQSAIDGGVARAAVGLGWMHEHGQGRPLHIGEANRLYRMAAEFEQASNSPQIGGYHLCRLNFVRHYYENAQQWCEATKDEFTESADRLEMLEKGFTLSIDRCDQGGFSSQRRSELTISIHDGRELRLKQVEQELAALSLEVIKEECQNGGNYKAVVKVGGSIKIQFSSGSFQTLSRWAQTRNFAAEEYQREQSRIANQQRQELRRREEARRLEEQRVAAERQAMVINNLRDSLSQDWKSHMEDQMSGEVVIRNLGDLFAYNRVAAIGLLSEGVKVLLNVENVNFRDGKVIIVDEHDPTDVFKLVRELELSGRNSLDRFMIQTQQVGVDFSGPSIRISCSLNANQLSALEGATEGVFNARLLNLSGNSVSLECVKN